MGISSWLWVAPRIPSGLRVAPGIGCRLRVAPGIGSGLRVAPRLRGVEGILVIVGRGSTGVRHGDSQRLSLALRHLETEGEKNLPLLSAQFMDP